MYALKPAPLFELYSGQVQVIDTGGKLMRFVKFLAAASLAVAVTATAAVAQTSSGSGVPTNSTTSTMGETNPGPTSDKGNAPMATPNQAAPAGDSAAGSGEKKRSLDH
jgi:hypothetical protein